MCEEASVIIPDIVCILVPISIVYCRIISSHTFIYDHLYDNMCNSWRTSFLQWRSLRERERDHSFKNFLSCVASLLILFFGSLLSLPRSVRGMSIRQKTYTSHSFHKHNSELRLSSGRFISFHSLKFLVVS